VLLHLLLLLHVLLVLHHPIPLILLLLVPRNPVVLPLDPVPRRLLHLLQVALTRRLLELVDLPLALLEHLYLLVPLLEVVVTHHRLLVILLVPQPTLLLLLELNALRILHKLALLRSELQPFSLLLAFLFLGEHDRLLHLLLIQSEIPLSCL
jgi:hypothetical protein